MGVMLLTNNQRKMHGLSLWRKKNKHKRYYTRCDCIETVSAFIDWCYDRGKYYDKKRKE